LGNRAAQEGEGQTLTLSSRPFNKVDELAHALSEHLPTEKTCVMAVDGFDGAGKSALARELAKRFGGKHFELDLYVRKNHGGHYIDYLRYEDLRRDLITLQQSRGRVICDGICVQAVLDRLGIAGQPWIYVRQVIAGGHWSEGNFLEKYSTPEEAIAGETAPVKKLAQWTGERRPPDGQWLPGLKRELIEYHYRYRPHVQANFVFDREASSG